MYLAQGGVFHCNLTEEKVDVVTIVDGMQEMRLCREKGIIIFSHFSRQKALFLTATFDLQYELFNISLQLAGDQIVLHSFFLTDLFSQNAFLQSSEKL